MFGKKDRTKEILDSIWDEDYRVVAAGEDAPSKSWLKGYVKENGFKLPKEYISHAANFYSGLYVEVNEEVWPRAEEFSVAPFWSFLYGVFSYAFNEESPEWMNADIARKEFQELGHDVLPILKVIGDADVYCLDKSGSILKWSHELDELDQFEGSFFDLLRLELSELSERKRRKVESL